MSSVAYPAQPTEPGWWRTAWLMFLGWLTAAIVLGGLYLAGTLVGAIGRNGYGTWSSDHAINDWPFAQNGTWSLLADVSVFALALVVTTIAIAWQFRSRFATVSEDRLFIVLLFTGGVPYVTSSKSAPLLFVIAVWACRAWVVKDDFRIPRALLLATGTVFVSTIASYGVLHPVWIESATTITPLKKHPTVMVSLHNQGRTSIVVERVTGPPSPTVRSGWPWEYGAHLPVRIPAGHSQTFVLRLGAGSCGGFWGRIRYRVLGTTRSEPLRLTPSGGLTCS